MGDQEYTRTGLFDRFRAAAEGDLRTWDEVVQPAETVAEEVAAGFALAMESVRFFADPGAGRLASAVELERFAGASVEARDFAGRAAARLARAALLDLSATDLALALDVHAQLIRQGETTEGAVAIHAGRGWAGILAYDVAWALEEAEALREKASEAGYAALVIEAAVLKAAASVLGGDLDEATTLARRASRMSRTESLPQEEYLANLILARVRRLTDKAHLAARILSALRRVATAPWQPWMCWELLLAGSPVDLSEALPERTEASAAVLALEALVDGAAAGDRAAVAEARRTLGDAVAAHALLGEDVATVTALLDAQQAPSPDVAPWVEGAVDAVPSGMAALGASRSDDGEAAYVVSVDGNARRVLTPGVPLSAPAGASALPTTSGQKARTDATVAALLLAGPEGYDADALFHRVYGFSYQSDLHRGVRDVLFHRVRSRVGDLAELVREGDRVALRHTGAMIAPDPRCAPPPEHGLLLVLASAGHASAKEAAERLGIPIRTAQDALRRLADDGACRAVKQGRRLEYHLEDTTFLEPTKV